MQDVKDQIQRSKAMINWIHKIADRLYSSPYLLLILATLFWGANAVAGKFAVGVISPMALAFLRWLIAAPILWVIARPHLRHDWQHLKANRLTLTLMGMVGLSGFTILLFVSLHLTSAVNVSIEQAAIPIFIIIINFIVFRAPVGPMPLIGIVIALLGVAITASHGNLALLLALKVNLGDAMMIVAALIYAGYTVSLRKRPPVHWSSFLAALTSAAMLGSLLPFIWEIQSGGFEYKEGASFILAYVIVFPSILSQLFYARGVQLIGPNRAGVFTNFVPLFGAGLAVLLLGEDFHLYHLAAFILVLGGIILSEKHRDRG